MYSCSNLIKPRLNTKKCRCSCSYAKSNAAFKTIKLILYFTRITFVKAVITNTLVYYVTILYNYFHRNLI